ncbi:MAG: hypothetical protein ACOX3D_05970 [Syntrophomonadales bacterium]|jgi:hypothetical protein
MHSYFFNADFMPKKHQEEGKADTKFGFGSGRTYFIPDGEIPAPRPEAAWRLYRPRKTGCGNTGGRNEVRCQAANMIRLHNNMLQIQFAGGTSSTGGGSLVSLSLIVS